ncbi:MAG: hypothetical protein CFE44_23765, partial [Burkholderiales bacterium PBB4]
MSQVPQAPRVFCNERSIDCNGIRKFRPVVGLFKRLGQVMKFRSIALAAVAVASFGAQAGVLSTYQPWDDFQPDTKGIDGVKFNVVSQNGVTVALGAHAYKNGVNLANNGVDTFYAKGGIFSPEDPGYAYANWAFDFAWHLGSCTNSSVVLKADVDPTANVNLVTLFNTSSAPGTFFESWNMEMPFINTLLGYDFNPNATTSTRFSLEIRDNNGSLALSEITVKVPEPASMA